MEKIDRLCSGLARQPMEDITWLSKMGAVRMSKKEVMQFLGTHSTTEGYHVRMVYVNKPMEFCLAYVMYEEMGQDLRHGIGVMSRRPGGDLDKPEHERNYGK
eukprot:12960345-Heterocapsa_arctica.AAC.1